METSKEIVYQLPDLIDMQYMLRDTMHHALAQAECATLPEIENRFIMWANQCYCIIEDIQNLINHKLCTQQHNTSQIYITVSESLLKPTEKGYMLTPLKTGTMSCTLQSETMR